MKMMLWADLKRFIPKLHPLNNVAKGVKGSTNHQFSGCFTRLAIFRYCLLELASDQWSVLGGDVFFTIFMTLLLSLIKDQTHYHILLSTQGIVDFPKYDTCLVTSSDFAKHIFVQAYSATDRKKWLPNEIAHCNLLIFIKKNPSTTVITCQ